MRKDGVKLGSNEQRVGHTALVTVVGLDEQQESRRAELKLLHRTMPGCLVNGIKKPKAFIILSQKKISIFFL